MSGKSAHVKNERQYEALKDKGMSKERCREGRACYCPEVLELTA